MKTTLYARLAAVGILAALLALGAPGPLQAGAAAVCYSPTGFQGSATPKVSAITPRITISRTSGEVPFSVHVSAMSAAAAGSLFPYDELEYTWDFGDGAGAPTFVHPVTGQNVAAKSGQHGPEAAYVYSRAGTYTITLNIRSWTGSKFVTGRTSVTVKALPWAGQDRYFDPVQGKDGNDGRTVKTPWQSWSRLQQWLGGGDGRRALLKRGTTMRAMASLTLGGARIRIASYGTGTVPVIEADPSFSDSSLITLWADKVSLADHVYQDLNLDGKPASQPSMVVYAYTSPRTNISFRNVTFLGCTLTNDKGLGLVVYTGGGIWEGMLFWGNNFSHGNSSGSGIGIYPGTARWLAVVGGAFTGGNGDMFRDHHIYPSGIDNMLFRWIRFGQARAKNFCINTNAAKSKGNRFVLVDGVNCTGTMNGIDMSNSDNDSEGRFSEVIVQSSAIHHMGSIGTQSNGLLGYSVDRYVIRDNLFYGNRDSDVRISDPEANLMIYRNSFGSSGAVVFSPLPEQSGAFTNNIVTSQAATGQPVGAYFSSSAFMINCNQYRFSRLSKPFGNLTDGSAKTFNQWRAAGFDVNGSMVKP